jgi:1-acyl-sn-glycerol-3-phosphate acyltransferase
MRHDALIRTAILALGGLFYPRIERAGVLPAGPLVLAANHPNGLLDGLVILLALGRPVAFLAKSTFFANPLLRPLLWAFDAVPVYRPGDRGRPGGAPPAMRDANAAVFQAARAMLHTGGILAIFPEGTPNPGPELLPLKTGAARIALEAEAEAGWQLGLHIVPAGLWFEDQTRAGTAAVVQLGAPIAPADLRERYATDPAGAVRDLTERLRNGMEAAQHAARVTRPRADQPAMRPRALIPALLLGAPLALAGLLLGLPGAAIAWLIRQILARRHRATLGTTRLVAWAAGLGLGWALLALVVGAQYSWLAGGCVLIFGPLCGYAWLRWRAALAQQFMV